MPQESPAPKEQLALTVPGTCAGRNGAGSDPGPGRRRDSGAAGAAAGRAALPRAAGYDRGARARRVLPLPGTVSGRAGTPLAGPVVGAAC